jgi:cell division protein FtsW
MSASMMPTHSHYSFIFEQTLFWIVCSLISIGLVFVASSSLDFASENYRDAWYFVRRQAVFLCIGFVAASVCLFIPSKLLERYSTLFLIASLVVLVIVLIPGIGKVVGGSRRWISLGPLGFQASEAAKAGLLIFFASYLARHKHAVEGKWLAFSIMVSIIGLTTILLLLEPDFGTAVIICLTLGVMMFIAGVPVIRFFLLAVLGLFCASLVILGSEYRRERLLSYLNPFADPYDGGYQLVQSLIAFGRGDWFGLGLGNSIQKLFFLPDAHTDFIFAIIAEETGMIGVFAFVCLFSYFVYLIFRVAINALKREHLFGAYLCIGVGTMMAAQAFVNMGVSSGLLPTKGLTLPFVSYGGSSLTIMCITVSFVLRIQWENKFK